MKKPSPLQSWIGGISIASILGALLLYWQVEAEVDARTTTEAELSLAIEDIYVHDIRPIQKDVRQQQRRWDRDDYKAYLYKMCELHQDLTRPEQDEFEEILKRLGYEWKGCQQ